MKPYAGNKPNRACPDNQGRRPLGYQIADAFTLPADNPEEGQREQDDEGLPKLYTNIETCQGPANCLLRKPHLGQGTCKTEAVKKAKPESKPGPHLEVGFPAQQILQADNHYGQRNHRLHKAR